MKMPAVTTSALTVQSLASTARPSPIEMRPVSSGTHQKWLTWTASCCSGGGDREAAWVGGHGAGGDGAGGGVGGGPVRGGDADVACFADGGGASVAPSSACLC